MVLKRRSIHSFTQILVWSQSKNRLNSYANPPLKNSRYHYCIYSGPTYLLGLPEAINKNLLSARKIYPMKNSTSINTALIILIGCYALPASAIVNVENMRVGPAEPGISGNLDLRLNGKRGNTVKDEYGINGRLQNNHDTVTNFIVASYDYGEVRNVANTNKSFIHGRHVVQFQPSRAWEAFVQAEKNEFARLSFRGLLGGGLRITLAETPKQLGLYLGIGAYWSRETLDQRSTLTDHGTEAFGRANLYVVYKHKLNNQLNLVSTTYYQPRLSDAGDFRALEQAGLAVKMTDSLSLKLSLDITHDSRPPQGIDTTDTSYNTRLSYQF